MTRPGLTPGWLAALYGTVAAIWVLGVHGFAGAHDHWADLVFVTVTALVLYLLVRRLGRRADTERAAAVAQARAAVDEAQVAEATARILHLAVSAGQSLLHAATEQELYEGLCRAVVVDPRFVLAWVGRVEPAPGCGVPVVAAAGAATAYADGLRVTWDEAPTGLGPTGTAVRTGTTQVANDIDADPRMGPWRERLLANGFRGSIALPILLDGAPVAVLSAYATEAGVFWPGAVGQLERLGMDAAFRIATLRAQVRAAAAVAEIERGARRLAGLRRLDMQILDGASFEAIATEAATHVADLTGTARAAVLVADADGWAVSGAAGAGPGPIPEALPLQAVRLDATGSGGTGSDATGSGGTGSDGGQDPALEALMGTPDIRPIFVRILADGCPPAVLLVAPPDDPAPPDLPDLLDEAAGQLGIALGAQCARTRQAEDARREAELRDDLADREARLRAILDGSPNPVLTVDAGGVIRFASPATATVFGAAPDALVGRPLADLLPARDRDGHDELVRNWIVRETPEEESHPLDVYGRRVDGSLVPLQILLAPHRTPEDRLAIVTVVDLSERVAMETRLRQAERLELLGQFAGVLAHDVRNFFSAVSWSAELLAGDMEPDDRRLQDVQLIQAAVRDGVAMTQSVLEFARPARDTRGTVDVAGHLGQLEGMVRRLLPEGVTLEVGLEAGLPHAGLTAGALTQVVLNLVTNARDAMPDGGVLGIEVRSLEVAPGGRGAGSLPAGRYVRLVVSDNGVGMDETTAAHAFEVFFTTKGDGTTANGTGLGLASVFLIVNRVGGVISVQTAPGEGTAFTIDLPAVPA